MSESDLPAEADIITKSFLEDVFKKSEQRDDIVVKTFDIATATKPGDSFLSALLSVDAVTKDGDNTDKRHHLMVKIALEGSKAIIALSRDNKLFSKEENVYTRLIPSMLEIQKGREQPVLPSVPTFYSSLMSDEHEILVLENLSKSGYTLTHSRVGLSFSQCEMAMNEFAKFHALGYALKGDDKARLMKQFDFLFFENYLVANPSADTVRLHELGMQCAVELFKAHVGDGDLIRRVEKLPTIDYYEIMRSYLMPESPFAVICHGDTTCRNILFKYNQDDTLIDVKLIDFQFSRYAVPTTDIAWFIYQSTDGELRKQHLDDLLRSYHTSLMKYLKFLNVSVPGFTLETFQELYEKTKSFGICYALAIGPLMLGYPEDTPPFTHNPYSPEMPRLIIEAIQKNGKEMRVIQWIYEAIESGLL